MAPNYSDGDVSPILSPSPIPMHNLKGHASSSRQAFVSSTESSAYRPLQTFEADSHSHILDEKQGRGQRPGMIRGFRTQIYWAIFFMFTPLLLIAALLTLIYANIQEKGNGTIVQPDTIEVDGNQEALSSSHLYVDYSATTLAFVSSFAATLALALIPIVLTTLFAYVSASSLLRSSMTSHDQLPTPFQLELLLRLLEGGTFQIYHYFKYLLRSKKKVAIVPVVRHAATMLSVMLVLAVGVTVVDALFHIKTVSVQYKRHENFQMDAAALPSRRLPTICWNATDTNFGIACNFLPGGSGAATTFTNSTEGYLTAANQSVLNSVLLTDDGHTAVIAPTNASTGVSFIASSFASSTECQTVTQRCDPHSNRVSSANADRSWAFDCTPEDAGLFWNANFSSFLESKQAVTFNIFNTSDMTGNLSSYVNATNGKVWFAAIFYVLREYEAANWTVIGDLLSYDENTDMVRINDGQSFGVLSCTTSLSNIVYTREVDGSIKNADVTPMNNSASEPFIQPLFRAGAGQATFNDGINLVAAHGTDRTQLAYQFARLFDRTLLSFTSGVLENAAPIAATKQVTTQVARVPRAELIALVVLSLLYPVIGLVLGVWALVLCQREGVRDVQARLGMAAMVAGVFEDKKFNASATRVEELYAEMRGLETKRVAVSGTGGSPGRKAKMLVGVS